MNFRILFIDDDYFMLKALHRTAKRLRPDWVISECDQPESWLRIAAEGASPDIIICDYQMPEINGEDVLKQAINYYPAAVRVLLTGDTSEEIVTLACQFSHHILGKPFSEKDLQQIFAVAERLKSLPFTLASREQLGQIQALPILPDLVEKVNALLISEQPDLIKVAVLLEHEPVLAAKLVQLANSAFLGYASTVTTIYDAVLRLGSKLVAAIVTIHALDTHFTSKMSKQRHAEITNWAFKHAMNVKKLAKYAGCSITQQDLVFSSAIFSGIGRLVEAIQPDNVFSSDEPMPVMQSGFLNSTLISVYVLTLWGYNETLCDILLWQDTPSPEVNNVEKLSFILFLSKQLLAAKSREDILALTGIIESEALQEGFQRLVKEIQNDA